MMQRELLGNVHPDVANTLNNLAFVQDDKGDLAGALVTEREASSIYRGLFPGDHPEVARIMNRIGYWLTRKPVSTQKPRSRSAARRSPCGGDCSARSHPDVASSLTHLAILQVETHKYREALESAVRRHAKSRPRRCRPRTGVPRLRNASQGAARAGLGEYAEAERLLTDGYQILSERPGRACRPTATAPAAIWKICTGVGGGPCRRRNSR